MTAQVSNNTKFSVLFLNSWYPNRTNDTLGNFVEKHIEAVSEHVNAYSVALFSDANCNKIEIQQQKKQNFVEIIAYYPKAPKLIFVKQIFSVLILLKVLLKIFRLLKKENFKFQLIHVNVTFPIAIIAVFFKFFKKIPYIITEHSTSYSFAGKNLSFLQKIVAKIAFKHASIILPVSENLANGLKKVAPIKKIKIVPNVVDVHLFHQKSKDNGTNNNSEKIQFIHISTANDVQKNLSGIIEVFSELVKKYPNVKLKIVSDGPLEKFKILANKLFEYRQTNIEFIGKSSTAEIANFLQESAALVLFSNYENFPCVIPESFSVGIPVISTNVNGIPEFVTKENGILFPPKDKIALKNAILSVINKDLNFSSNKIRSYAEEQFSYEAIGKKIFDSYKEVLHVS